MVCIRVLYKYFWLSAFQAYGGTLLPISVVVGSGCRSRHHRLLAQTANICFLPAPGMDVRSRAAGPCLGDPSLASPATSSPVFRVSSECTGRETDLPLPLLSPPPLPPPIPLSSPPLSSSLSLPLLRRPEILL